MHEASLIPTVLFVGFLLALTTILKGVTRRIEFPYTIAMLLAGFIAQFLVAWSGLELNVHLTPDFIFFVLLPLLLFESASKINSHQFKLQFRTISFLATFGLLLSVGIVGWLLMWLLDLPLGVGLLFGTIISATDPIAVLAIFHSLGAPKRLGMIAEGESMFNDATAVILFRVIGSIVIAEHAFGVDTLFSSFSTFVYVFVGSLLVGWLMGLGTSYLIEKVENDRIIETTLTVALALVSFGFTEHFLHLSGVISTVAAGIALSTYGRTRISGPVLSFMREFWEYTSFMAISLVFFFAAFSLETLLLFRDPFELIVVIGAVLLARTVSIYLTFGITNRVPFFQQEPNVPLSWQTTLNWGGLRGVIPLVLVYSLPDTFVFKELLVGYTLVVFVYSLLVHGLSIKKLVQVLKLDRPERETLIIKEEMRLLEIEESLDKIDTLPQREFDDALLQSYRMKLIHEAEKHKSHLLKLAKGKQLLKSLKIQAITIEREALHALFQLGHISETTVMEFEGELDLQQDALEYPQVKTEGRHLASGKIQTQTIFQKDLALFRLWMSRLPWFGNWLRISKNKLIKQRIELLKARLVSSEEVIRYLEYIAHFFQNDRQSLERINQVKGQHVMYNKDNQRELDDIQARYPSVYEEYQTRALDFIVSK